MFDKNNLVDANLAYFLFSWSQHRSPWLVDCPPVNVTCLRIWEDGTRRDRNGIRYITLLNTEYY